MGPLQMVNRVMHKHYVIDNADSRMRYTPVRDEIVRELTTTYLEETQNGHSFSDTKIKILYTNVWGKSPYTNVQFFRSTIKNGLLNDAIIKRLKERLKKVQTAGVVDAIDHPFDWPSQQTWCVPKSKYVKPSSPQD